VAIRTGRYDCVFERFVLLGFPNEDLELNLAQLESSPVSEILTALLVRAGAPRSLRALPLVNTIQTYSFAACPE